MSFQVHLNMIGVKTDDTSEKFKALVGSKGLLKHGITATSFIAPLKEKLDLGRCHGMAIFTVFK